MCRLESIYGSILGIFSICGPEDAFNKVLSNSLYRRLLFEITSLDLWKKNEVKHFTLLSLLSILASIISHIPECQKILIRKNNRIIHVIHPYSKIIKNESKVNSLKYNYLSLIPSIFIGKIEDIKNNYETKLIKKISNYLNKINSCGNNSIKKMTLSGSTGNLKINSSIISTFLDILSDKKKKKEIKKKILLLRYVNLLSIKLEPLVRQTTTEL